MKFLRWLFPSVLFIASAAGLTAGPDNFRAATEVRPVPSDARFEQGRIELSLVSGALFAPVDLGGALFPRNKTTFDYTQTEVRFGIMLHSPWEGGILRGNFEAIFGAGGGAVFRGPGTGIANADLFFRYNFVQRRAFLVPYWQIGLGLNASDVSRDHDQRIIGQTVEFTLQSGMGLRFLLNERWSLDVEVVYQHLSNADGAERNVGVNAVGGLLGVTCSL